LKQHFTLTNQQTSDLPLPDENISWPQLKLDAGADPDLQLRGEENVMRV